MEISYLDFNTGIDPGYLDTRAIKQLLKSAKLINKSNLFLLLCALLGKQELYVWLKLNSRIAAKTILNNSLKS